MCKICETKPVYEFTNKRKLCKNCFIKWFEKKFLYTIRKFELIQKEDIIGYQNKEDFRSVVLKELLKMYSKKGHIQVVKTSIKKRVNKKAVEDTTDVLALKIIKILINKNKNKLKEISPKYKKTIRPLCLFLNKEVYLYAKLKKLKFKQKEEKKDKYSEFLNSLEDKHPEVKRAVINGYLKLD